MHDEVGFPHYLVDKEKFKKRFKKYDHVSAAGSSLQFFFTWFYNINYPSDLSFLIFR